MRYFSASILAAIILSIPGATFQAEAASYQQPHEDEAGWNCRAMGNLTCGPDFILALRSWQ